VGTGGTGVKLWSSAPRLLAALERLEENWQDVHVLDLGAGCGAISLGLAKLGAKVWATDYEEVVLQNLRWNVQNNGLGNRVHVVPWDWNDELPLQQLPISTITHVVGSDLLWGDTAPMLAKAIFSLRAHNPNLTFFLGCQERESLTVKEFWQTCIGAGLALHLGPLPHMVDWNCKGASVDSSLGSDLLQSECTVADFVIHERKVPFFFLHMSPEVDKGQSTSLETNAVSDKKVTRSSTSCFAFFFPYSIRES